MVNVRILGPLFPPTLAHPGDTLTFCVITTEFTHSHRVSWGTGWVNVSIYALGLLCPDPPLIPSPPLLGLHGQSAPDKYSRGAGGA